MGTKYGMHPSIHPSMMCFPPVAQDPEITSAHGPQRSTLSTYNLVNPLRKSGGHSLPSYNLLMPSVPLFL